MPRTVVNRIWQRLMGRGIVENVDEMDGEPWSPELLDWLASDFVANGYDLKALIATILESRTYQLPAVRGKATAPKEYVFRGTGAAALDRGAVRRRDRVDHRRLARAPGRRASAAGRQRRAARCRSRVRPSMARESGHAPSLLDRTAAASPSAAPAPVAVPSRPDITCADGASPAAAWSARSGRPIRDQVYSTRDTQATTIQALELVNGETLTHWLWRGARHMLGELPAGTGRPACPPGQRGPRRTGAVRPRYLAIARSSI